MIAERGGRDRGTEGRRERGEGDRGREGVGKRERKRGREGEREGKRETYAKRRKCLLDWPVAFIKGLNKH